MPFKGSGLAMRYLAPSDLARGYLANGTATGAGRRVAARVRLILPETIRPARLFPTLSAHPGLSSSDWLEAGSWCRLHTPRFLDLWQDPIADWEALGTEEDLRLLRDLFGRFEREMAGRNGRTTVFMPPPSGLVLPRRKGSELAPRPLPPRETSGLAIIVPAIDFEPFEACTQRPFAGSVTASADASVDYASLVLPALSAALLPATRPKAPMGVKRYAAMAAPSLLAIIVAAILILPAEISRPTPGNETPAPFVSGAAAPWTTDVRSGSPLFAQLRSRPKQTSTEFRRRPPENPLISKSVAVASTKSDVARKSLSPPTPVQVRLASIVADRQSLAPTATVSVVPRQAAPQGRARAAQKKKRSTTPVIGARSHNRPDVATLALPATLKPE